MQITLSAYSPRTAPQGCRPMLGFQMACAMLAGFLSSMEGMSPMALQAPQFGQAPCQAGSCSSAPEIQDFLGTTHRVPAGRGAPQAPGPNGAPRTRGSGPTGGSAPQVRAQATSPQNGQGLGNIDVERLVAVLPRSRRQSARRHFPIIIAEARRQNIPSRAQLAYILATANHESGSGLRMEEIASGRAYEGRRGLGNTQPGDGVRFKGRGYVQITGRRNYTDWSRRLGVDLVGNPELAERPDYAARILVGGMRQGTFTGRPLDRYINERRTDFDGARRTIGGGRGAERVSEVARRLLAAMG